MEVARLEMRLQASLFLSPTCVPRSTTGRSPKKVSRARGACAFERAGEVGFCKGHTPSRKGGVKPGRSNVRWLPQT
eukprot:5016201-Lingulodinium_polyedra.AAC.1